MLPGSFLSAGEKLSFSTTVSSQGHRSSSPDRGKKAEQSRALCILMVNKAAPSTTQGLHLPS